MPTLEPQIVGGLRQSITDFSSDDAWEDSMPYNDATGAVVTGDSHANAIYCLFGLYAAAISTTDIRVTTMSFDTSGISEAPSQATLKVYGITNNATGQPSSDSTNGILCLKTDMILPSVTIAPNDWGAIDLAGSGPVVYSNTLTSWNVGTSTTNDFTLNATALSDMASNDEFDLVIAHKAFYDWYDNAQPFAWGNNSPNGDNDFTAAAGAYWSDSDYKPVIDYELPSAPAAPNTKLNIKSGKLTSNGGEIKIKV